MPSALEFADSPFTKTMYIGDSSTGKTGSLLSLIEAGYKIRMIDLDAGIGTLIHFIKEYCPERLDQLEFVSPRDKYKASNAGVVLDGPPAAFIDTMKYLDEWEDGTKPAEWGPDYILVLDSFTRLGKAAYNWFDKLNPVVRDKRQIYKLGQDALEDVLSNVTADAFRTNVIIISHVRYNESQTKGYASALGSALGPTIPTYFNNLIMAETTGQGDKVRRTIKTQSTGVVDLKNERSFKVSSELPLSSGLATLFESLKGK